MRSTLALENQTEWQETGIFCDTVSKIRNGVVAWANIYLTRVQAYAKQSPAKVPLNSMLEIVKRVGLNSQ
jgi:hypothetical protein